MNTYLVQTLKEIEGKIITTDFVIQAKDESEIKIVMTEAKLIVLWIKLVSGWPKSAEFFADITYEQISLTCCVAAPNLQLASERFLILWLPVTRIHNKENNISQEQSDNIIQWYLAQVASQKIVEQQKREKEHEKRNEAMNIRKQQKITEVITQTINDINTLPSEIIENPDFFHEIHQLNEYRELLTKMKMWSNIEKSATILEETFKLMERLEMASIASMKSQEQEVIQSSVISNVDIVAELDKIKRAKEVNDAGIKKNSSDFYYTLFWLSWLYQKFIAKDILNKLLQINSLLSSIIRYMNFILIWVTVIFGITIGRYHINHQGIATSIYISLLILWIGGISRWSLNHIRDNKNTLILFMGIILAIGVTILIKKLLIVNLALL